MKRPLLFYGFLFQNERTAVCTLVHGRVTFMCADLDRFQCAVIFGLMVVSAVIDGTSDTFITLFHVKLPPLN